MLSRYEWLLNGKAPGFSANSCIEQWSSCAYYIQAPENCKETPSGECNPLEETLELRLMRQVGEGLHEDVYVTNHTQIPIQTTLELRYKFSFTSQTQAESGRKQFEDLQGTWSEPNPPHGNSGPTITSNIPTATRTRAAWRRCIAVFSCAFRTQRRRRGRARTPSLSRSNCRRTAFGTPA